MHLHAFPYAVAARQRSFWPQGVYPPEGHPAGRPTAVLRNEAHHRQRFRTFGKTCRDCHVIAMIRLIRQIIVADDAYIDITVTLRKTMKSRHQPTHEKRAVAGQRERLAFLSARNLFNTRTHQFEGRL